jgi:hypothetical protein
VCCFCGEVVALHDARETFTLNIGEPSGPAVTLRWHYAKGCAEGDPISMEIAEASALPDGPEGDLMVAAAYLKLLNRLLADHGEEVLQAAVDVRRDVDDPWVTLRGPGASWGRRSERRPVAGPSAALAVQARGLRRALRKG